ncbi:MAG: molybdenum cofactor biosynthesis protein [Spirochaetes bacterium]|nr:MAG: molybdenum cofactor biosynthesis protein [Spirochaetota bacterium]
MKIECAIITVSDRGFSGERIDKTGKAVENILRAKGFDIKKYSIVPDDEKMIEKEIKEAVDHLNCDIVLTNGGTGLSPKDITPDVTKNLIDYEIPGISEAMRFEGYKKTVRAVLSRAVSGVRGRSIVINLPGSVKGATESLEAVVDALPHAVEKLHGSTKDCGNE